MASSSAWPADAVSPRGCIRLLHVELSNGRDRSLGPGFFDIPAGHDAWVGTALAAGAVRDFLTGLGVR